MLRIPCPYCGVRDEEEFRFGGESHITRPGLEVDDARWADYLFNRTNPKGLHYERWLHSYGCGRWFNLVRDTVTHEVLAAYPMGAAKPRLTEAEPGNDENPVSPAQAGTLRGGRR